MGAERVSRPAGDPAGFRELLGRPLRVGGIDYLNSRPLLEGLAEALGPEGNLENHVPRELALRLRSGELDAALVPVVEYLAGPPDYRIVPAVSISSYGAVESIRFFHRAPLGRAARVGLDSASLTSALLVRLLFAGRWAPGSPPPAFEPVDAAEAVAVLGSADPALDAVLLIGDGALACPAVPGWSTLDLGTEWTRWTGLPFVYALWVARRELPGLAGLFQRARDLGLSRIDAIVERGPLPEGFAPVEARRYLQRSIHYELGPAEIEGLLHFRGLCLEHGLLDPGGPASLRFLPGGPGAGER